MQNNDKQIDLNGSFLYDIENTFERKREEPPCLQAVVLPHWFIPKDKSTLRL